MRILSQLLAVALAAVMGNPSFAAPLPVPDTAAQARAETMVHDIFKGDYAKRAVAVRRSLAGKLLAEGQRTADDPAAKFVLLRESAEVAASAGDFATLDKAIAAMGDNFAMEPALLEADVLLRSTFVPASLDNAAMARTYANLLDQLMAGGNSDPVVRLAPAGLAAARKGHEVRAAFRIEAAERDAHELQNDSMKYKAALATLAVHPESADANAAAGRFVCFRKGDFLHGLPLLVKGSDSALAAAARKDLANPTDARSQAAAGNAWYDLLASERSKTSQANLRARAARWYVAALDRLTGLERLKTEKRLAEVQAPLADPKIASAEAPAIAPGPPVDPLAPSSQAGAAILTAAQREALAKQKAAVLEEAALQSDPQKRLEMLTDAATITLQFDPAHGIAELDDVVREAAANKDPDRAAVALILQGKYFGAHEDWTAAQARLARAWKEFRGADGERGCEAAAVMADHFESLHQPQAAIPYKAIMMECGGAYGGYAGDAGLWLADYYLSQGDKAKAVAYLKTVYERHAGWYGTDRKKAQEKLVAMGETLPNLPK